MSKLDELAELRADWVNRAIAKRVGDRADFTDDEFDAWYGEAHEAWRARYPALTALFPSHLEVAQD